MIKLIIHHTYVNHYFIFIEIRSTTWLGIDVCTSRCIMHTTVTRSFRRFVLNKYPSVEGNEPLLRFFYYL